MVEESAERAVSFQATSRGYFPRAHPIGKGSISHRASNFRNIRSGGCSTRKATAAAYTIRVTCPTACRSRRSEPAPCPARRSISASRQFPPHRRLRCGSGSADRKMTDRSANESSRKPPRRRRNASPRRPGNAASQRPRRASVASYPGQFPPLLRARRLGSVCGRNVERSNARRNARASRARSGG